MVVQKPYNMNSTHVSTSSFNINYTTENWYILYV